MAQTRAGPAGRWWRWCLWVAGAEGSGKSLTRLVPPQARASVKHPRAASSPGRPAQATPRPAGPRMEAGPRCSAARPRRAAGASWAAERRCPGPAWSGARRPVRVRCAPQGSLAGGGPAPLSFTRGWGSKEQGQWGWGGQGLRTWWPLNPVSWKLVSAPCQRAALALRPSRRAGTRTRRLLGRPGLGLPSWGAAEGSFPVGRSPSSRSRRGPRRCRLAHSYF